MPINVDDEILQDFLVEAGEILETLSEQLIELEQRSTDKELLNSVFRGFHTVKGGAGFLNITSLVNVCHRAEDVFNVLRQGQRVIDADLMDVVLRVVDTVNNMMSQVRAGVDPDPADESIIKKLEDFTKPIIENKKSNKVEIINEKITSSDDIEKEFDELLSMTLDPGKGLLEASSSDENEKGESKGDSSSSDEISDEEFEALLDQIHGKTEVLSQLSGNGGVSADDVKSAEESSGNLAKEYNSKNLFVPKNNELKDNSPSVDKINDGANEKSSTPLKPSIKDPGQHPADATVRVDTKRLDDIMNLVGELVLVRNRLATLKANMENDEVSQAVGNLDVVTSDLQAAVMKTRMQPIKKVFGRFPRVIRDLSRALSKEIDLKLNGEETDLDKNLVEALADPLVHLVRNSIDHGIESPSEREAAGKSRVGTIVLSAKQEGDHILLSIKDDGAGMNADKLRVKAIEKGLLEEEVAARLEPKDCYNLIFLPGFSTKSEISDISGRGVGMDVVKTRITQLNGSVDIDSEEGKGTEIIIKLPLTLAIVPTLMVVLDTQIFAIPLANVREIIQLEEVKTNVVEGRSVAIIRNHPLPLFHLGNWLIKKRLSEDYSAESYVVVVKYGSSQIACVVDQLMTQEEVVIKPLGALLHGIPGLAGATITGDGRIALILDMPALMTAYAMKR